MFYEWIFRKTIVTFVCILMYKCTQIDTNLHDLNGVGKNKHQYTDIYIYT